ncbi:PTS lactose/cellobiose transporter subunit IIA [Ectobacillus sp. JY-23]|uniref:PTS lactose/cellobiose transporter subunit IIA n=1 Tax=Ectobacillus sp. JY-23 TaxID=2933872 RepID=UPI001FF411A6|nr:PTS lactose/cellobiose transporter subunit IIA [Ectobacillus sp. JY-23]UOY91004.1 PTS lactose/cellobiose transporter subunit IIA [Ectobacillus sp. JY-23]
MTELNTTQQAAFQLILYSGNARSYAMEAMQLARQGAFTEARTKLEEAKRELKEAHHAQTSLIQAEARGEKTELSVLLIHAQDHLMNAITVKELTEEIIYLHEKMEK